MLLCIVLLMLRGGNVALSKKKPKLNLGDVDYILNVSCHNDKEVQVRAVIKFIAFMLYHQSSIQLGISRCSVAVPIIYR